MIRMWRFLSVGGFWVAVIEFAATDQSMIRIEAWVWSWTTTVIMQNQIFWLPTGHLTHPP